MKKSFDSMTTSVMASSNPLEASTSSSTLTSLSNFQDSDLHADVDGGEKDSEILQKSLRELAELGQIDTLKKRLKEKKWPKKILNPALLGSAQSGNPKCFKLLLEYGASPFYKDQYGRNSIHLVIRSGGGNLEIVRAALSMQNRRLNAYVNSKDRKKSTSLFYAAEKGYLHCVKELVLNGAKINEPCTTDRNTPLIAAASKGYSEIVHFLISKGADYDKKNVLWGTALSISAQKGFSECVKLLLEAGSDINASDYSGCSALNRASEAGHLETVKVLVENKADINHTDNTGRTSLLLAISGLHQATVDYLIDSGADVNITNSAGLSPFLIAVKRDDLATVLRLVSKGANVSQHYMIDGNALHMASLYSSLKSLTYLITSQFKETYPLNGLDEKGKTPLTIACEQANAEVVLTLLQHGADPEVIDEHGRTALTCALAPYTIYPENSLRVVKTLIRYGCQVNNRAEFDANIICYDVRHRCSTSTKESQLPFEIAVRLAALPLVQMLWASGASTGQASYWHEMTLPFYLVPVLGGHLQRSEKTKVVAFLELINQPRSLLNSCLFLIRSMLGLDVPGKSPQLGLPHTISDLFLLPELDEIEEEFRREHPARPDSTASEVEIWTDSMSDTSDDLSEYSLCSSSSNGSS